jgi:pyruvate dehydrogenase E1 component beta subunit|tara:strand:- start:8312 stop:9382 length:1071 start_codon:yes stop_codon:yes gene_type:complete
MPKKRILTASEAINEATIMSMKKDKKVYVIGEGVNDPKEIFGTTRNLKKIFGKRRVVETPISENAMTGLCIGSAMMGLRPIQIHQRVDFALLALEQIINNCAKAFFVSNSKHTVPLVIRMIIGRGWGQGPMHSQILDSLFAQIPGLKVLMPTFPKDFKGMMLSAIEDPNPVVILEHRWLHNIKGNVPQKYYKQNINKIRKIRTGKNLTIVANGYNLLEVIEIQKILNNESISFDLFDLNVIQPLQTKTIINSVKKTGRILVIDSGFKKFGLGAEIISQISENCIGSLKAKPVRMGLPFIPTPSSRFLAKNYYPNKKTILCAVLDILNKNKNKIKLLKLIKSNIPVDVPDLNFKGPF